MRRYALLFGCSGLFVFTMACTQQAPPPPDTRAADVKAVQSLEAAWVKDIATKDVDKVASYFADDGSEMMSNMPIATGRDNIKAHGSRSWRTQISRSLFSPARAEASKGGDLVYTVGTYSMTMSAPRGKKPVSDKGKYLTVFRKQADGTWKVVADMSSSDLPAASATK